LEKTAAIFEIGWRSVVMQVAKGGTSEIHALRPQLVNAFDKRLSLLKTTYDLAKRYRALGRMDIPDPDGLLHDIACMMRLKAGVFDRWQTAEDLEDLAARDYPLTTAELEEYRLEHRPPASWYAEESKPF
jgi:hypothetical protein